MNVNIDDPVAELEAIEAEIARRSFIRRLRESIPLVFHTFFAPARYKGAHGGRGSAKSWTFAALIILTCIQKPGTRVVCIREVQKSLGQSVKRLLEDTIARFGLTSQFRILNNVIETPGNGIIIFQGMQDHTADTIKSLEGFDIAWVEEAQSLSLRSMELLRPTLRKDSSELWFTWNPRRATDPVDQLLRASPPPSAIVRQVNYNDNPHLPKVLKDELEWDQRRDREKFEHIWLGAYEKHAEARVFKNWRVEEFEDDPKATYYYGGDWGYSVDPATLVRATLKPPKTLLISHEAYRVGVEIDAIPTLFDTVPGSRDWPIRADSSRPDTISYLQRHGFPRMVPSKKGKNSVREGVIFLQSFDIIVHPRCVHTIDELTMYSFKVDKLSGIVTPVLKDDKNHIIDPLRYAVEELMEVPPDTWVTW